MINKDNILNINTLKQSLAELTIKLNKQIKLITITLNYLLMRTEIDSINYKENRKFTQRIRHLNKENKT